MDREMNEGTESIKSVERSPSLAFIMSCFITGWGFLYIGKPRWAFATAGLLFGGLIVSGVLGLIKSPHGLYVLGFFVVLIKLGGSLLSAWQARKPVSEVCLPSIGFHVLYILIFSFLIGVGFTALRPVLLGYDLYYVPSGSMMPTLSFGDYIIADTHYDVPKVGDIVVYRFGGEKAVKRIAAVGGESLAIVNGDVFNNGRSLGLFHASPERIRESYSLELAPVQIRPGYVYLLGDNRDSSNDSRFIGQVPALDITGKVTGIWYSTRPGRAGTLFE